jgi:hypothetical protein
LETQKEYNLKLEISATGKKALTSEDLPTNTSEDVISIEISDCDELVDASLIAERGKLSNYQNVKKIELKKAYQLTDISFVSSYPKLKILSLDKARELNDFSLIATLIELQHLNLEEAKKLKDIQFLKGLKNLGFINLSHCSNLEDIAPLKGLPKLYLSLVNGTQFPRSIQEIEYRALRRLPRNLGLLLPYFRAKFIIKSVLESLDFDDHDWEDNLITQLKEENLTIPDKLYLILIPEIDACLSELKKKNPENAYYMVYSALETNLVNEPSKKALAKARAYSFKLNAMDVDYCDGEDLTMDLEYLAKEGHLHLLIQIAKKEMNAIYNEVWIEDPDHIMASFNNYLNNENVDEKDKKLIRNWKPYKDYLESQESDEDD